MGEAETGRPIFAFFACGDAVGLVSWSAMSTLLLVARSARALRLHLFDHIERLERVEDRARRIYWARYFPVGAEVEIVCPVSCENQTYHQGKWTITRALEEGEFQLRRARVTARGTEVVDHEYVRPEDLRRVDR